MTFTQTIQMLSALGAIVFLQLGCFHIKQLALSAACCKR